jgi:zinc/manganese transport system permease protein
MELMLPALVAALILMGLHAYLGIHIIARGVIFVDLALAQVAAMGWAAAGLGLGHQLGATLGIPETAASYLVGLTTTLVAAALFSLSRMEHAHVPQEAIIGIVYVVASAGTILLASQAPRGSEHVEHLLTGSLLWVTWPEIWRTASIYAVLGVVHWFLRERFLVISLRPQEAKDRGRDLRRGRHYLRGHRRGARGVQLPGHPRRHRVPVHLHDLPPAPPGLDVGNRSHGVGTVPLVRE